MIDMRLVPIKAHQSTAASCPPRQVFREVKVFGDAEIATLRKELGAHKLQLEQLKAAREVCCRKGAMMLCPLLGLPLCSLLNCLLCPPIQAGTAAAGRGACAAGDAPGAGACAAT